MHRGSGAEDGAAMVFGDVFQEKSRSSAGGGAPGGGSSLFGYKHGVDQWYSSEDDARDYQDVQGGGKCSEYFAEGLGTDNSGGAGG